MLTGRGLWATLLCELEHEPKRAVLQPKGYGCIWVHLASSYLVPPTPDSFALVTPSFASEAKGAAWRTAEHRARTPRVPMSPWRALVLRDVQTHGAHCCPDTPTGHTAHHHPRPTTTTHRRTAVILRGGG